MALLVSPIFGFVVSALLLLLMKLVIRSKELYQAPDIGLIAFDIYLSESVQFAADGHFLPLTDQCVDGVIIQDPDHVESHEELEAKYARMH